MKGKASFLILYKTDNTFFHVHSLNLGFYLVSPGGPGTVPEREWTKSVRTLGTASPRYIEKPAPEAGSGLVPAQKS